ncbi:MAG: 7-cyano-7-deazaguanine synthase QueC [Rhodospirillales bacterium]
MRMSLAQDAALVLFSGGQDSTTCLAWALARFARVDTVAFDYRQRHAVELSCREAVLAAFGEGFPAWAGRLGRHHLVDLELLARLGETALTGEVAIAEGEDGLPTTFVPGRNLLFLTVAAIVARRRAIRHVVGGMCETDYSGYPDCRDDTVKAMQLALNRGMEASFVIHTPLMWLDKAATWRLAADLGGSPLVELIVEHTHTCYRGDRSLRHPWGYGCAACPACTLRRAGHERFIAGTVNQPETLVG